MNIDVSLYPQFKSQTLQMIEELDTIYNNASEVNKAAKFTTVLKKFNCLP